MEAVKGEGEGRVVAGQGPDIGDAPGPIRRKVRSAAIVADAASVGYKRLGRGRRRKKE